MDRVCHIFLVGDSLFAETLAQLLGGETWIQVAGTAVSPHQALACLATAVPDLVIMAHAGDGPHESPDFLLEHYPDIPLICADLNRDYVQIITSRRVGASRNALLAAIAIITGDTTDP
jgi:DNA-binding NarL/FixJ family response regulator